MRQYQPPRYLKYADIGKGSPAPGEYADMFIAERYKEKDQITLRHKGGAFYRYHDGGLVNIPESELFSQVIGFLRDIQIKIASKTLANAIITNLKGEGVCHIPYDVDIPALVENELYTYKDGLIALPNCILDTEKFSEYGEIPDEAILQPDPNFLTFSALPVHFIADADCPKFKNFLDQVIPDKKMQQLVLEIIGLLLTPDSKFEKFFIFFGNGANGKSVLYEIIIALLGLHNVSSVPLNRFDDKFSRPVFTKCLANIVSELPSRETKIYEDIIKTIVSGERIEHELKGKDKQYDNAIARLIFLCNQLPHFFDNSNGIDRRMIIVPFGVTIPEDEQNPNLAGSIISEELPGILNLVLKARHQLYKRGNFDEPEICKQLKAEHRLRCNPTDSFFKEYCENGSEEDFVVTEHLYRTYRIFCDDSGYSPKGKDVFIDDLKRCFPKAKRNKLNKSYRCNSEYNSKKRPYGYNHIRFFPDGIPDDDPDDVKNSTPDDLSQVSHLSQGIIRTCEGFQVTQALPGSVDLHSSSCGPERPGDLEEETEVVYRVRQLGQNVLSSHRADLLPAVKMTRDTLLPGHRKGLTP